MSRPRIMDVVDNTIRANGTIISSVSDYAEVGEWVDGNPDNEDRVGYFVSIDVNTPGMTIVKSTKSSEIRGVSMSDPGFSANASPDKFGSDGELLSKYTYVGWNGAVSVIDKGRCTINSRCVSDDDGTAIPSTYGYHVIDRIDPNHVLILLVPTVDKVIHPATTSNLGVVKPDGTTITIGEDGTIHGSSTGIYSISSEAPSDTKLLWIDSSNNFVSKYYNQDSDSWETLKTVAVWG